MSPYTAVVFICTGLAPTHPVTNVEIEVRRDRMDTIRYEIAEGSMQGTAYIQSLGELRESRSENKIVFASGTGELSTRLTLNIFGDRLKSATFSHYSSGMKETPVDCAVE